MISAHIFSITKRLLGLSSLALLFSYPLFVATVPSVDIHSSAVPAFCWSGFCGLAEGDSAIEKGAKLFIGNKYASTTIQKSFSFNVSSRGSNNVLMLGYTPPSCNDTDADQTNNCGPNDTGDAGTRMSV